VVDIVDCLRQCCRTTRDSSIVDRVNRRYAGSRRRIGRLRKGFGSLSRTVQTILNKVLQSQFEDYLPYLGGAAGALFVTGVAYWASRPTAEKPLFPLDAQALLLPVRNKNMRHHVSTCPCDFPERKAQRYLDFKRDLKTLSVSFSTLKRDRENFKSRLKSK